LQADVKTEIDLWTVRLKAGRSQIQGFFEILSAQEQQRAAAFRFERHRDSFVIGRGLLRAILGWYLRKSPQHIDFQYGPRGKPSLYGGSSQLLHFNLAHSENVVLYAVTRGYELGVDVEFVWQLPDAEHVAQHFFSEAECADLFSVAADLRAEAFFNCWTRKEAYLKAIGDGLSLPLHGFEVSLIPGRPAAFLKLDDNRYPITQWTLIHLTPLMGYIGALAIPAAGPVLLQRTFPDAVACLTYLRWNLPQ
jgi:4'-phosphopantetheinyl transferase